MNNPTLSRRHLIGLAGKYGLRAVLGAAAISSATGVLPVTSLLSSVARAQSPKYKIRFGAGIMSRLNEPHFATGLYKFVSLAEEMTDGSVRFEVVDSSQSCSEATCGERVLSGVIDIGSSSPQNLGTVMPYSIAMDFPFLWQGREGYINFFYSKDSNRLYRDVMRRRYDIEPLWVSGEMRNILLGLKFKNKSAITEPADFKQAKIRITNSVMIANFIRSIGSNPIPLAWTETLEGLKSGVVDGAETWPGAATGFGMHNVVSHDVPLEFCVGCEMIFMSRKALMKLPTDIQEKILEAAYQAMQHGYEAVGVAKNKHIGNGPNPEPTSAYMEAGIKLAPLSETVLAQYKELANVEKNSVIWSSARSGLDRDSGFDTFAAMTEVAAKYNGKQHSPQRWWV
ncbi:TRAP transporter substrate-binding protein [Filomicrobium sp.]|uniref:TRAP transporter substrate-binding protein n=1 Tax=Filomicrobium sp. TaxID=2024831 RepID=UPI00258364C6|nr:TRAP transporter substrate-binding protein [Filomicrobium sp.]MCV0370196.1 TRAP transporter substrate-binding protein [Filomicrobium sp.]